MPKLPTLRRAATLSGAALALALAGCAGSPPSAVPAAAPSTSRILSSGPAYAGEHPVARLYIYFFIDARPDSSSSAFRRAAGSRLADALRQSGIPSEQLWFGETSYGKSVQANLKNHTYASSTFVVPRRTIWENLGREIAFGTTHRLIVYPHETLKAAQGTVLNVKWDVIDAASDNYEWSVYSQTTALSSTASPAHAEAAADRFVAAIMQELRARGVVPGARGG